MYIHINYLYITNSQKTQKAKNSKKYIYRLGQPAFGVISAS